MFNISYFNKFFGKYFNVNIQHLNQRLSFFSFLTFICNVIGASLEIAFFTKLCIKTS